MPINPHGNAVKVEVREKCALLCTYILNKKACK